MIALPEITLLCVETRNPELALWAIERCIKEVRFSSVVLLTNLDLISQKKPYINYVQSPKIHSIEDYSDLLLTCIEGYVEGTHVLVMQWDSFIVNSNLWQKDFLDYDYIGAVWPHHPEYSVGNGGFSLRSRKLLQAMKQPGFVKRHPEDYCICVDNREFLQERCNIRFAPPEIAEQFSVERSPWHQSFGFHGLFNFGKVLDDYQISSFLEIEPNILFKNLDVYDLIEGLISDGRIEIAKKIFNKVGFSWKRRCEYIRAFIKLRA